jgi:hypothetical protein
MPYRKCTEKPCIVDGIDRVVPISRVGRTFFCCFSLFRHGTMTADGHRYFSDKCKKTTGTEYEIGHVVIADGDGIIKNGSGKCSKIKE